jgi:trimeric autotransporter adhesin
MPMIAAMTAAEIAAAAEAAAVATAAAEAAAAAQAASAASTAATAATAAAPTVAAAAPSAGILGAELGAANALSGAGATQAGIVAEAAPAIEAATAVGGQGAGTAATQAAMESTMQSAAGAPASLAPPAGITAVPEAATTVAPAGEVGMSEAQRAYLEASEATLGSGTNVPVNRFLPAPQPVQLSPDALAATGNAPASTYSLTGSSAAPGSAPMQYQLSPPGSSTATQGLKLGSSGTQGLSATSPGASSFGNLPPSQPSMFDKFSAFADKHPFMTGATMFTTAYKTGMLDQKPVDMPEKKKYGNQYTMSKDFQASEATPNVYEPTYRTYAEGGGVMEVGVLPAK